MYIRVQVVHDAIYISAISCGHDVNSTQGRLNSPGYPNDYPHDLVCAWTIIIPVGNVSFDITDIDVEGGVPWCFYDALFVSVPTGILSVDQPVQTHPCYSFWYLTWVNIIFNNVH